MSFRSFSVAYLLVVAILFIGALPALAHTAFESSNPDDGSTIAEPVESIEVVFSGEASPAGDGFVVLDPAGAVRSPERVISADNLTWLLEFDTPLAGGVAGVRWSVAAPDAHPIEGSFSFTVAATAAEVDPPTTAPSKGSTPPVVTPGPADVATSSTTPTSGAAEPAVVPSTPTVAAAQDLDSFLETDNPTAFLSGSIGFVGRALSLLGAMVGIGGIVFAAVVMRGSARDIRSVLYWVRRAAVMLGLGTALELLHQIAVVNGDWLTIWPLTTIAEVLWAPLGLAISLRFVGAALMVRSHIDVIPAVESADPVLAMQGAVGIGAGPAPTHEVVPGGGSTTGAAPYLHEGDKAWRVDGELALVGIGILATLSSFAFDGHTVTEGIRWITALVGVVHVGAGAVWAGGLVMLVHVVWLRHRRGSDTRALQLAVRFSVVAAASLVVAGAAGTALAMIILDSPSELWSTPWGRILIAKVAVVAVAGAAGGYNHKVLIPHMMRRPPNDPETSAEFRRAVTMEGAAIGLVIVLTAALVAAAA